MRLVRGVTHDSGGGTASKASVRLMRRPSPVKEQPSRRKHVVGPRSPLRARLLSARAPGGAPARAAVERACETASCAFGPSKTASILTVRITSKGQVTIPLELRQRYGLGAGVEVEVLATEGGALVRPVAAQSRGRNAVARMRDRADGGLDADAVLTLTRGDDQP
jgi:AbrB family looped-hinge helix DNA binding protein